MKPSQLIEQARQSEQKRLDLLLSPEKRNQAGQFATPNRLALAIMEYVWKLWEKRTDSVHFLEPSLGTGSFYSALLQVVPEDRLERAQGIELDPDHATAAQSLWKDTSLRVVCGDFTREPPPPPRERFNLLVANPPYVRHHHIGREEKERLQALALRTLGIRLSGLAGLYCHFMLLADQWLTTNSLSVWLIPSEFLDVNYGVAVKRYLKEKVKLLHVHRFCPADVQFGDALVSSAIVVFEKARAAADHQTLFSLGGSILEPQACELRSMKNMAEEEKWARFPTLRGQKVRQETGARTLGELFTIKRGLATGANGFFILERSEARRQGIPDEFLRPILPNPRQLPASIIEAAHDGFPLMEPQFGLIDCELPEEEVRRHFPGFWSYLEQGKARKIHEGYITSRRSPWYSQEDRPPAPFLCTYMGRSQNGRKPFRFLWNQSNATAHNVYLLLYPKGALKSALAENPDLYHLLFQVLQGIDTDDFKGEGRVYGGGLYKMEPKELARVSGESLLESLENHLAGAGFERELPFS